MRLNVRRTALAAAAIAALSSGVWAAGMWSTLPIVGSGSPGGTVAARASVAAFARVVVTPDARSPPESQTTIGALQDPARHTRAAHMADRPARNR